MKILRTVFLTFLVVLIVAVCLRNFLIRFGISQGIRAATGLSLTIESLDIGLLKPVIEIKGLKLYNPPEFTDKVMVSIPEVYVQYSLKDLIQGYANLNEVQFELEQLTVVKNENGLNLDTLTALKPPPGGPPPKFAIDSLTLKIGKVVYKDYTLPPNPSVQEFNLNLEEHYTGINGPFDLVRLIIVRTLTKTTVARLAEFDINSLQSTLSTTVIKSLQNYDNPLKKIMNNVEQTFQKFQK